MDNHIKSIKYSPQEYLEIELEKPLMLQSRIYYLEVPFLLNCFVHIQSESFLYFDTQHYLTLKYFLSHNEISKDLLKMLCLFLIEQYEIIDDGYIILQLDYIFYDQKNNQVLLCKVPTLKVTQTPEQLLNLFLEIYDYINYKGDEEWISQLYLVLKSKPCRLPLLKQFLTSKKTKKWLSIFKKDDEELNDFFKMMQVKESKAAYGNITTPFETQILMAGYECGYLVDDNQQRILITSVIWRMGRSKQCDYVLDFPEVSKDHCLLSSIEGKCFIEDLGSTNGTFVNGGKLISSQQYELKETDVISLAGHHFTYHV